MFEKICELLADKFDVDASTLTMDTKIKEDLKADSLDIVEMIMDLEGELGVELDMEDQKIATFQELADFIESKLN